MAESIRKIAICFTGLIAAAAFLVISPFYTAIAIRQGIPQWLIGFIFSTFPLASIVSAIWVPKLMFCLGRHNSMYIGVLFIGSSNILISFLESCSPGPAIAISFISRAMSGIGAAHNFIAAITILMSDYPAERAKLSAMSESFIGLGLIIGPSFGSLVFMVGGFSMSCRIIGLVTYAWIPVLFFLLGPQRIYHTTQTKEKLSIFAVVTKPVVYI